jgi:hypothetical protein
MNRTNVTDVREPTDLEAALFLVPHLDNPCGENHELADY